MPVLALLRRESAAEAGPLEFLTLLAQAPRSVSPRAGLRRLHSSAVYRHGFESARPLMLAMWRCRGTVQITAPGSAVRGTRTGDPQLGQQYCPSSPCQILAGMTRVRLCEIGVPREVSSNRPRRPPAGHYRSMAETILVDTSPMPRAQGLLARGIRARHLCVARARLGGEEAQGEEARQCESPINGHARRLASRSD